MNQCVHDLVKKMREGVDVIALLKGVREDWDEYDGECIGMMGSTMHSISFPKNFEVVQKILLKYMNFITYASLGTEGFDRLAICVSLVMKK